MTAILIYIIYIYICVHEVRLHTPDIFQFPACSSIQGVATALLGRLGGTALQREG